MYDLMKDLDFNTEHITKAFEDVEGWLKDINMASTADYIFEELPKCMAEHNPFEKDFMGHYCPTPTDAVIYMIYEIAKEEIFKKFPDAIITYTARGYDSWFKIDDATYKKGLDELCKEEEEE